mgnify:CR=1 FL=1
MVIICVFVVKCKLRGQAAVNTANTSTMQQFGNPIPFNDPNISYNQAYGQPAYAQPTYGQPIYPAQQPVFGQQQVYPPVYPQQNMQMQPNYNYGYGPSPIIN